MKRKWFARRLALLLALALALTSLAACGPGGKTGGEDEGLTLRIACGADPVNMDPRKTWVGSGYSINYHIAEPLVFRQYDEAGNVSFYGVLAESWEQPDELTWQFNLRQGVTFHNGEPFTSSDVKFTIESMLEEDFISSVKTWMSDVASIETPDESTVVITTKTPARGFLASICQVPIVSEKAVTEMGDEEFNLQPVGTGPYVCASYTANSEVVLERYDGYWGKAGQADRMIFRIMPESSTRVAALKAGEVDIAENIPTDKVAELNDTEGLSVQTVATTRVDFMGYTIGQNKWIDQKEFRQAISLAIDRQLIVDTILGGTTVTAKSVSPVGSIGYDETLSERPYDPEQAKQLLADIGYDGSVITMGGCNGRYAMDSQVVQAVADMLMAVGINVELTVLDWSSYQPKRLEFDFWYIGQTDFTNDPGQHWSTTFLAGNDTGYSNPEVDELVAQANATMEEEGARALYQQAARILVDDEASCPLFLEPSIIGVSDKVQGLTLRSDEYLILTDVTLAQ